MIDYYSELGLRPGMSKQEIEEALLKENKKWISRQNANSMEKRQEAEQRVELIRRASEILCNPEKRAQYDRELQATKAEAQKRVQSAYQQPRQPQSQQPVQKPVQQPTPQATYQQPTVRPKRKKRKWWKILLVGVICWTYKDYITYGALQLWNYLQVQYSSLAERVNETSFQSGSVALIPYDESILADADRVNVIGCDATSYLSTQKGNQYPVTNCVDGDVKTCWQDGVDGFGEGSVLSFSFEEISTIHYIGIWNGRASSDKKYYENGRVEQLTIRFGEESYAVVLDDVNAYQLIKVEGVTATDTIQLVIDSVYAGSTWEDTCITEIEFY